MPLLVLWDYIPKTSQSISGGELDAMNVQQLPQTVSKVELVVKNLPANAGDTRNVGWIPGLGRSTGEGKDNTLQYSCLENPMDRGACQATVHEVCKGLDTTNQALGKRLYIRWKKQMKQAVLRSLKFYSCILVY